MPTQLTRIPLAWPIGERAANATTQDPYIFNMMLDKYGDLLYVKKRPGSEFYNQLGTPGNNQGFFFWSGLFWLVVNDILYREPVSIFAGADGTSFTDVYPDTGTTIPQWSATEGMGSCVFSNRMWMIGGVTNAAGIWSSVDGVNWAVNAGGQPWGQRTHPGVCVFNELMWVMGGYNTTLASAFNDVWSSPDGTNWTLVSPDTGAITMWNTRTSHCVLAANNGMYVYGGEDATGAFFYDDIWYSTDGASWTQLNTAATGTARAGASMYWFNNNLWIVGGLDSGGNYRNDAWYSADGITWAPATAAAFSSGRFAMFTCVYRNQLWAIGGKTASGVTADVYSSSDGATWSLVTAAPGFTARAEGACLVFAVPPSVSSFGYQTIYILGGEDSSSTLRQAYRATLNVALPTQFGLTPDVTGEPYDFTTYLNGQLLIVKNSSNLWVLQSGILSKVTDVNYPKTTVRGVVNLNAFLYVMTPTGEIHNCALENPFEWPSLDFITADYSDDEAVALAKHLHYVVALSQYSTQFFFDNGANQPVGSPLGLVINANSNIGCAAGQSLATVDNSLFFMGLTIGGGRDVRRIDGLNINTVSTPYVDRILMQTGTSALQGFNFSCDGHQFYVIKTEVDTALVYDTTYQEWYEWDTFNYIDAADDGTPNGVYLLAVTNGNIVLVRAEAYTDAIAGVWSSYVQTDKVDFGNTFLKYFGRATLVGDTVMGALPAITYSDDDYTTYVNAGTVDMGSMRPFLTRLGSARRRAWKPIQTDSNAARWQALEVSWEQGESH